jgi:exopolysaccharide biosynthesis predicted pyruvyltransferase EpsI
LIRFGEITLLDILNLDLKYTGVWPKSLDDILNINDTILFHGGGNLNELYQIHSNWRNEFCQKYRNNTIISMPQSIYYKNETIFKLDTIQNRNSNKYVVTSRAQLTSRQIELFNENNITFKQVPDAAFMIGPRIPNKSPTHSIFILIRTDKEQQFSNEIYEEAYHYLQNKTITFIVKDWFSYKSNFDNKDISKNAVRRNDLVNNILSQGKVIITDRLHCALYSLLMGKPLIVLNNNYNKTRTVFDLAFEGKEECSTKYLNIIYSRNPLEAVHLAEKILANHLLVDGI